MYHLLEVKKRWQVAVARLAPQPCVEDVGALILTWSTDTL